MYLRIACVHGKTTKILQVRNVDEIIEDYKSLMNRSSKYRFDFDLNKIKEFGKKLIPCSLIHGDLGIYNRLGVVQT